MKFRNFAIRSVPEDLPIQIEIRMHNPVPHRHDLPPRHFWVSLSQFNRQTADRLADDRRMVQYRCRQHLVFEERIFVGRRDNRFNLTAGRKDVPKK